MIHLNKSVYRQLGCSIDVVLLRQLEVWNVVPAWSDVPEAVEQLRVRARFLFTELVTRDAEYVELQRELGHKCIETNILFGVPFNRTVNGSVYRRPAAWYCGKKFSHCTDVVVRVRKWTVLCFMSTVGIQSNS